jgi:hypothetical protein
MNNNIIAEAWILMGLTGGTAVFLVAIITPIVSLYRHFTWKKFALTDDEKEEMQEAVKQEYPTNVLLNKIIGKRGGFSWTQSSYNKITGELKIR